MENENKNSKLKVILLKSVLCFVYLIVMSLLALSAYKLYENDKKIVEWSDAKSSSDYSYMKISRMSEKFAYDPETKTSFHFAISKEQSGAWHTYLIAINENDYQKYKNIIDYTYERTVMEPSELKVYGYPTIISQSLKKLALKNIKNFVPAENEIEITDKNFENYLSNSYIDTTKRKKEKFNYQQFTLIIIFILLFIIMIYTIFSKNLFNIEKKSKKALNKNTNPEKNIIKNKDNNITINEENNNDDLEII